MIHIHVGDLKSRVERFCRKLPGMRRRKGPGGLFYIGGNDVLPPPLDPVDEARVLQEYADGSQDARTILI